MAQPGQPPALRSGDRPVPIVQVEREAWALLADLAALGEPLPAHPAVYGRPLGPTPPEPEPERGGLPDAA